MSALRAPRADIRTPLFPLWPSEPPQGYRGQLADEHQVAMRDARAGLVLGECSSYHASTLKDGTTVTGVWDHRGREPDYLGVPCARARSGQRALHLVHGMPGGAGCRLRGRVRPDDRRLAASARGWLDELRQRLLADHVGVNNAWWYLHRDRDLGARIVYGNIYDLPDDRGTFDVAFFGSILLHLRDPFGTLEQAADRTTDRMIVTDMLYVDLALVEGLLGLAGRARRRLTRTAGRPGAGDPRNLLRFAPEQDNSGVSTLWWHFSPAEVANMLRRLGFGRTRITYHARSYRVRHDLGVEPTSVAMFTVVGQR